MIQKSFVILAVLIILCVATLYLIFANISLKRSITSLNIEKENEFREKLAEEKGKIINDLNELHRADMVSFEAMSRKFEKIQNKVKDLQAQLNKNGEAEDDKKTD